MFTKSSKDRPSPTPKNHSPRGTPEAAVGKPKPKLEGIQSVEWNDKEKRYELTDTNNVTLFVPKLVIIHATDGNRIELGGRVVRDLRSTEDAIGLSVKRWLALGGRPKVRKKPTKAPKTTPKPTPKANAPKQPKSAKSVKTQARALKTVAKVRGKMRPTKPKQSK